MNFGKSNEIVRETCRHLGVFTANGLKKHSSDWPAYHLPFSINAYVMVPVMKNVYIMQSLFCPSGGDDRFEVDPDSGVVRTKGNQPFRLGHEYEIGVSATDRRASSIQKSPTYSLKILVGERDPQFFETQYIAEVPETAEDEHK